MNQTAIILGSARSDGNTRSVVDLFIEYYTLDIEIFDLNDYELEYFDYHKQYSNEHYIKLFKELVNFQYWIFATPVYWYSMSALLKNFMDRITDVMDDHHEMMDRLKKISIGVISCGASEQIPDYFGQPFALTAKYLDMEYAGHVHTWTNRHGHINSNASTNLKTFANRIKDGMKS